MRRLKGLAAMMVAVAVTLIVPLTASAARTAVGDKQKDSPGKQTEGDVKLKLKDVTTGDPVAYATVSVTKVGESIPYRYTMSDDKGVARLEDVKSGSYTLKAELLGYVEYTATVSVAGDVDLGEIQMKPDAKTLDAASVSAVGNPIVIKKDTVEYTASSFKTTDNDMLESLLKKLPGVEVGDDGSITSNGETVSKIYIDGKTFFLDDPQLASKNIPAKIIDKVKVVKKKSEQAQFTGIDDGNEETVIDLSIHAGMMNGLFGNVVAGAGHDIPSSGSSDSEISNNDDFRYRGTAFIGNFTDKHQLSVILNANNANSRGFNDMAGNAMRGMRSGGFGSNQGITTSWMGGLNGSTSLFHDKMDLEGNYLYNGSKNFTEEYSNKTYIEDGSSSDFNRNYITRGTNNSNTSGHRIGARIEHEFSKNTSILFQPQFNIGTGDFNEQSSFTTNRSYADGTLTRQNDGFNSNLGDSKNASASGFFLLRQRLGKAGRTVSFNVDYSFSNNKMDGFNQSQTDTYDEDGTTFLGSDKINQRYAQNNNSASLGGRLTYTEPIAKNLYLEGNYSLNWNRNTSEKNTWDSGFTASDFNADRTYDRNGETYNDVYSSKIVNRYINQRIGADLMFQNDKLHAQVGFGANPTDTYNETNGTVYKSQVVNWSPQAMVFFDKDDNTNMRLFYFGNSSQPSTSQLMSVPDNSNPLSVSFGNMYLKPYFSHTMRAEYRKSNKQTFSTLNLSLDAGLVQNPIVSAEWTGSTGVRYSMPVNGHNSGNVSVRMMLNTPIAKSNFSISSFTNARYSETSSYYKGSGTLDMDRYYDASAGTFDYDAFFADVPDFDKSDAFALNKNQSTSISERLRFTYRNDLVEFRLGGRTSMTKAWNTIKSTSVDVNKMKWNNQLSASMDWTFNFGMGFDADADYNWYNGYTTQPKPEFILNAQISQLILKKTVTLAVSAYDIFNQSKNVSPSSGSMYLGETVNNTLGRYVIFSITFRFGTMGGKNIGRGPGGPGGGPGGPGGGPGGPPPMR